MGRLFAKQEMAQGLTLCFAWMMSMATTSSLLTLSRLPNSLWARYVYVFSLALMCIHCSLIIFIFTLSFFHTVDLPGLVQYCYDFILVCWWDYTTTHTHNNILSLDIEQDSFFSSCHQILLVCSWMPIFSGLLYLVQALGSPWTGFQRKVSST